MQSWRFYANIDDKHSLNDTNFMPRRTGIAHTAFQLHWSITYPTKVLQSNMYICIYVCLLLMLCYQPWKSSYWDNTAGLSDNFKAIVRCLAFTSQRRAPMAFQQLYLQMDEWIGTSQRTSSFVLEDLELGGVPLLLWWGSQSLSTPSKRTCVVIALTIKILT